MTLLKWLLSITIAFAVGKLRLPAILGCLITGIVVGPYALKLISDELISAE